MASKQQKADYAALKAYGLGPARALEIQLDAKRGDTYAKSVLELARDKAENPIQQGELKL